MKNRTLVMYLKDETTGPDIVVGMDDVTICGHHVARPTRISRSVWMAYWETRSPYIERS